MFSRPSESSGGFAVSYVINHAELQFNKKLEGGEFGMVYQGSYRQSDVAIKQLLMKHISADAAAEFEREVKVMAQLRSPHVVQFYGYCVSPNYCIVMEYMPNGSLFSILHSDKLLDWPTRFRIAVDMAKGLSYLHHENILHRDIKSLNVLLDAHYQAKLADFGLSKLKTESRSHQAATKTKSDSVGTTQWMAPELFTRKAVFTYKCDIYSLGITFWELAARKIPFSDAASQDLIPGWVKEGEREDIPADCPSALKTLIEACWSGEPSIRPGADEVVTQLKKIIIPIIPPIQDISASRRANYQGRGELSVASRPQYQDNFGSEVGPVGTPVLWQATRVLSPQPKSTFSIGQESPPAYRSVATATPLTAPTLGLFEPPPAYRSVDTLTPHMAQLAIMPQIDANKVRTLLKLVAEGEQDEAEKMLKATPTLALAANNVTDLSDRTFKGITAFQYAVWALDWHMWSMIQKYMTDDAIREQLQGIENRAWAAEHGETANWQHLIAALDKEIELSRACRWEDEERHWSQQVGGAQRLLPVHVVNEYCYPNRSFNPCPDFNRSSLPRTRNIWPRHRDGLEGEWFTAYYEGRLGETFGVCRSWGRGNKQAAAFYSYAAQEGGGNTDAVKYDRDACRALLVTRTQQRDELVAQYSQTRRLGPNRR